MNLLTNDLTFKYVFSKEKVLEDFINSFMEYEKKESKFNFTSIEPEKIILPNHKDLKYFIGDIVATLSDNKIISIEMYKNNFNRKYFNKSVAYMCRLYLNQMKRGKNNYESMKEVISINIIKGNYLRKSNKLVNEYSFRKKDLVEEVEDGNLKLYLIRLDILEKMPYIINEERFKTILRIINAKSIEEMERYGKGDEIMDDVKEYVKWWNKKSSEDAFERYLEEEKAEAREQAEKITRKEMQNKMTKKLLEKDLVTAKRLLEKNLPLDIIKYATQLSEKQILSLRS